MYMYGYRLLLVIDYDALMVWWARGAMKHETNDRVSIMNFTYCRCR